MEKDDKAVGIGSALIVVVIGAGIYLYKFAAPSAVPAAPPPASAPAETPAAPASEPLPKLEESDGFVRSGAASLSADATFAAWLKTDDLLSRFAAAVSMIGQGKVPKDGLSFMAPHRKFSVRKKDGKFYADASDYARYDAAANAVGSLDAKAAVSLFRKYRPLLQEAYQSLGERKGDVQDAFVRAASELLTAPVLEDATPLKEKGLGYAYVDDALEGLSPAQKQLMRMGPKNQKKVQAKLSELALALGASGSQIPK